MTKIFLKMLMFCSKWRIISVKMTIIVNFHDNSKCVVATSIQDLLTKINS